jgi:hypothetical protein
MRPGEKAPVHGNAQAIELLEHWLVELRKGEIGYVGIITAQFPDVIGCDAAGIAELEPLAIEAISELTKKIDEWRAVRALPPRDPTLTADYQCYNCADAPVAWDFLVWAVDAVMQMEREGAPAPLKVAFHFGGRGAEAIRGREQMFNNVVRPLLALVGAVEDDRAMLGRHKPVYVAREICAAARAGQAVPMLRASAEARDIVRGWFGDGPAPVVITLREAEHWPHRNSNTEAWLRFARDLRDQGEKVVIVRDTAKAREPIGDGFLTCPAASVNVDMRMAVYEASKASLFVSNGPVMMAVFSQVPYLNFMSLIPDDAYPCNRPGFFPRAYGIPDGGQFPWARHDQRMVWALDTYENISAAWHALCPALAQAA